MQYALSKRSCRFDNCICMEAKVKCTSLCITKCDNMVEDEENVVFSENQDEEELNDIENSDIEEDF